MKKIKIEICDTNGEQITVAMSGQMSKEKLLQILQIFEDPSTPAPQKSSVLKTTKEKLMGIITADLNKVWFTSKDLSLLYQERYREPIKASTISTYLTRLYSNGYLERKGNRSCWQYRLVSNVSANQIDLVVNEL
ncbi:MAG: hypothetical protein QFX35_01020 [Candidatus Verstraetearchaeota archaeon]|nr:hypothetical protein [Candidatus Verstraetearchaeota archaeon]